MKIGFIGLGIMGRPMALNLLKAGHSLVVLDWQREALSDDASGGDVATVSTNKEVAQRSELVITMVPDSPQVKDVVLGEDGVIEGAHDGLVFVDMSSINPLVSQQISTALAEKGVPMLDAPVSGGEPKAIDGTLSVMVGGDAAVFEQVKDVLAVMAGSVTHVGAIGAGNITKLANQVIVAINIAAVGEALVLAQKAGVDPAAVYEAIRGGLAGSTVLDAKAPMMLDRDFAPGFRINLHIKDLVNTLSTSHEVDAPMPLTASVLEMMTALKADGHETEDHSALLRYYEKLAGTELTRGGTT